MIYKLSLKSKNNVYTDKPKFLYIEYEQYKLNTAYLLYSNLINYINMKLKNLFVVLTTLSIVFGGLTSCSNDDDNKVAPIVGTWNLKTTVDENGAKIADMIVYLDLGKEGEPMKAIIEGLLAQNGISGGALANKVESVTARFSEDGKVNISFKEKGSTTETNISQFVDLHYYTSSDGKMVYIGIEKKVAAELLPLLSSILGKNIDIPTLQSILVTSDQYYSIPLNLEIENNYTKFYVKKDYIAKVAAIANEIGLIPTEYQFLPEWINELSGMDDVTINVGLGFIK